MWDPTKNQEAEEEKPLTIRTAVYLCVVEFKCLAHEARGPSAQEEHGPFTRAWLQKARALDVRFPRPPQKKMNKIKRREKESLWTVVRSIKWQGEKRTLKNQTEELGGYLVHHRQLHTHA